MGTMAAPPFKVAVRGTGNTSRFFFMRSSPSRGPQAAAAPAAGRQAASPRADFAAGRPAGVAVGREVRR